MTNSFFGLEISNSQYYFGMKTIDREILGLGKEDPAFYLPKGLHYGMTKAFMYLKEKKEFDDLLNDPNFEWLNTRNDTYALVDRKPEYVWDGGRGEFVRA